MVAGLKVKTAKWPGPAEARPGQNSLDQRGLAQIGTLTAEGLAVRARAKVFALDVVAGVAVGVVVVDARKDRVPRITLSHFWFLLTTESSVCY